MPTKLILKFMCVWLRPRQSPCVIFTMGAKVENITKILIVFERGKWKDSAIFFFFQPTVFILSDVGRQKEVAEAHNAAIQEQVEGLCRRHKACTPVGVCVWRSKIKYIPFTPDA